MNVRVLVGSGHKIAMFILPFAVAGLILNIAYPWSVMVARWYSRTASVSSATVGSRLW
jgi:hypothetical protein